MYWDSNPLFGPFLDEDEGRVLTNPPDTPDFQSEEEEGVWNKAMAERGEAIAWHTDAVNKGGRYFPVWDSECGIDLQVWLRRGDLLAKRLENPRDKKLGLVPMWGEWETLLRVCRCEMLLVLLSPPSVMFGSHPFQFGRCLQQLNQASPGSVRTQMRGVHGCLDHQVPVLQSPQPQHGC
jgi:hypothetical protein